MVKKIVQILNRSLDKWTHFVCGKAIWAILMISFLVLLSLWYSAHHLGLNTDVDDMLSKDLPFQRLYSRYEKAFPQDISLLVIVIDADTPEFAREAANIMVRRLKREKRLFIDAYRPDGGNFLESNGLLFQSEEDLEKLTDSLARVQPALAVLYRDQSLRGLFSMLGNAVELLDDDTSGLNLDALLHNINKVLASDLRGESFKMSWQDMMKEEDSDIAGRRKIVIARPLFNYHLLFPAKEPMDLIHAIGGEMEKEREWGIRVRITGGAALGQEEMESLLKGSEVAGMLSLLLVSLTLFIALRSLRLILATFLSLVAGIILTAGFAALAVGHLNLISIAFAVLYIGLGVDYAIHLCLRFRELNREGLPREEALRSSIVDLGPSLGLCTLSTMIGFYAFIPTAYAGVSELGLISGTGMVISLIITLSLLPALIRVMPAWKRVPGIPAEPGKAGGGRKSFIYRHARPIRWAALILGLGSLLLLPRVQFELDPIKLRDPETESVSTLMDMIKANGKNPSSIIVMADDEESARNYARRLEKLQTVEKVVFLDTFIPEKQKEKMFQIETLDLILGQTFNDSDQAAPPSEVEDLTAVRNFLETLKKYPEVARKTPFTFLGDHLREWLGNLEKENPETRKAHLDRTRKDFLETLPLALAPLRTALSAEPFGRSDLPPDLYEMWVSKAGEFRVQVFPKEDISDNKALRRFVGEVRTVAPDATSGPVFTYEAGRAIVASFKEAMTVAFLFITILLFLVFRNWLDPLFVLIPLVIAGILTSACTVLLDVPFNFANIIALPLLLGLGVDNGIHMVHRMKNFKEENNDFLKTSTARGVFYSALTTVFSFGTLAVLSHQGTASLGKLLALGVLLTMATTLIILPAFYLLRKKRRDEDG